MLLRLIGQGLMAFKPAFNGVVTPALPFRHRPGSRGEEGVGLEQVADDALKVARSRSRTEGLYEDHCIQLQKTIISMRKPLRLDEVSKTGY